MPKNVQIRNVDDATYERLRSRDVPLLTCDARLGRAHGHQAEVIVYPSS